MRRTISRMHARRDRRVVRRQTSASYRFVVIGRISRACRRILPRWHRRPAVSRRSCVDASGPVEPPMVGSFRRPAGFRTAVPTRCPPPVGRSMTGRWLCEDCDPATFCPRIRNPRPERVGLRLFGRGRFQRRYLGPERRLSLDRRAAVDGAETTSGAEGCTGAGIDRNLDHDGAGNTSHRCFCDQSIRLPRHLHDAAFLFVTAGSHRNLFHSIFVGHAIRGDRNLSHHFLGHPAAYLHRHLVLDAFDHRLLDRHGDRWRNCSSWTIFMTWTGTCRV